MIKTITINYDEYENFNNRIQSLNKRITDLNGIINSQKNELSFLKEKGDNIFVIVKTDNQIENIEYRSDEKNLLLQMVEENKNIRLTCNEINAVLLKYVNQNNDLEIKNDNLKCENEVLKNEIDTLKRRGIWERLTNKITQ